MASELYIEDKLVDLPTDAEISIDYAIAKIGEIEKRSGARSAEFTIPKTAKNKAIFENPDDVNNVGTKPYRRLKARYYSNGIDQQISFATLKESAQGYSVNIYGGNSDFFAALKDGNINEIICRELDYFHLLATYVATRTELDICRSIAKNFEQPSALTIQDIRYQPPSVSIEWLLEKIAELQGYTINNQTKEKYGYPNQLMVLPLCKEWIRDNWADKYNVQMEVSGGQFTGLVEIDGTAYTQFRLMWFTPIANSYEGVYYDNWSTSGTPYVVSGRPALVFPDDVSISVTITMEVNNPTIYDQYFRIGYAYNVETVNPPTDMFENLTVIAPSATETISFTITQDLAIDPTNKIGTVAIGYTAEYFDPTLPGWVTPVTLNNVVINSATLDVVCDSVITPQPINFDLRGEAVKKSTYVSATTLIPDIKQSDLLATYLKLTCSLIQVDEVNKVVNIVPFEKITDNIPNALDWSNKLDLTDTPQITFAIDGYAQRNLCTWQYDEAFDPNQTSTFANGVITLDDANLENEQDLIEIDFSASTQALTGGFNIADLQLLNDDGTFRDEIDQRILFAKFNDVAFTYTDGTNNSAQTTSILLTHFQKSGEINLGFDDNLIPTFYQAFIDVLDKAKIVTCLLRLNASDINQLDLTKPVYIGHFNSYFYVSDIKGYNPDRNVSTMVELVKLY